jgi:hypothetical protein
MRAKRGSFLGPEAYFVGSHFGGALYIDKVHASPLGRSVAAHLLFEKVTNILELRREKTGGNN